MSERRTPHRRALGVALGMVVALALTSLLLARPELAIELQHPAAARWVWPAVAAFAAFALLALSLCVGATRLARGTPGRLRLLLLGYAAVPFSLAAAGGLTLLHSFADKLPGGAALALEDAFWVLPQLERLLLMTIASALAAGALVSFGALLGGWFLLPARVRKVSFLALDAVLVLACAFLTYRYRLTPSELSAESVRGASARLLVTLTLGVRIAIRLLPFILDAIELVNFRSLVAARHLRAKKSGFLAAISFLSILAVSVSSCALTTTLSVMGGFRQDLKRKILGNNAHIVVDRADGKIANYEALAELVRKTPGVRGVAPYVSGEVMISSASNLAGAVLRGIDLDHIGEVSELPDNMRVGALGYLKDPERLSQLPASQLGMALTGLPKPKQRDDESDVAPGKSSRLSDELDKALREPKPTRTGTATRPPIPGIVVGQELARSLRLYLGDEVNVVTPLGDLGPSGPLPKSRPFRVAGIFYSGMYEYDMKFAYVMLTSAQRFLSSEGSASGIEITVHEPERAQEVAIAIARNDAARQLRVRPWQELNKNLFGALALEKLAMFIALGIAILVASFCIVGTLTLMVQEKGREVAVLKAMGTPDRAIVGIFVLEGTLIGVLGSVLGLSLGYAVCFAAEHFGIRLNPEVYYIDRLPVHIDISEFLAVGFSAVAVSLLVTIYPAQLASRLRPVDALRYE